VWNSVDNNYANLGIAEYGRIILQKAASLGGQIIIDAKNGTGQHRISNWKGDVVIGSGSPDAPLTPIVISTNPDRAAYPGSVTFPTPAIAPLYQIPSAALGAFSNPGHGGGGAVGLVPFARYDADSNPANAYGLPLGQSDYVRDLPVTHPEHEFPEVAHYGPVKIDGARGVMLSRVNPRSPLDTIVLGESSWDDSVDPARPRMVRITSVDIPPGRYRVTELASLQCDLSPGYSTALRTLDPQNPPYDFVLGGECVPSVQQTCQCSYVWCFLADFNFDQTIDGDDVIAFYEKYDASDLLADLDFSGGVDGDDIILFYCWWEGGCSF
jgi:hypothetical protein